MFPDGVVDTALYGVGALALGGAVRWWRPELPRRWAAGYALLTFLLFSVPLATARVQVPVDMLYQWLPWYGTVQERVEPQNTLLADVPLQMLPFRRLVRQRLLSGEAPLWAHELGTGQPLLGNGQSAPFAPLHLMALPVPPIRALTVAAAWQILVGLLLAHALALALLPRESDGAEKGWSGARQVGAAVCAIAFALSAYSVVWLYHPLSMVAMFLPGLFLGIVTLARGEPRALGGLIACAIAMAVSGHPETVAHAAVAALGTGLVLLVGGPGIGRARFAGRGAVAAVLAFALAAPAVLPILETLPESERMSYLSRGAATGVRPPPVSAASVLPLVQPLVHGSPREGDWDGPRNFNELCSHYAGLLTLGLALGGALVLRGRILAIVGAGALALAVALGVPPAYEAFDALPGLEYAAHGRMRLFWVLAVALAAGLTTATLGRTAGAGAASRGRRWSLPVAGVILAVAGVAAFYPPPSMETGHRATWWVVALAGTGGVALLLGLVRPESASRWGRTLLWLAPAAILLDLALLGARYHPLVPPDQQLAASPSVAWLQERFEASPEPFRVIGEGWTLLPNLGAYYGLWDPRGNDPARPARPLVLIAPQLSNGGWRRGGTVLLREPWDARWLGMLGVRYVLTHDRKAPRGPFTRAFDGPGDRILELETALPLFWVPERIRPADRPEAAHHLAARVIEDFGRRAAVYDPASESEKAGVRPAVPQRGEVWIHRVEANGFELVTRSREGMVVASSVSAAPGWRLEIDGERGRTVQANWAFVGFRVPPGVHRVELRYAPASWRWGLVFFGAAVAGCLAAWVARRFGRRRLGSSRTAQ